VLLVWKEGCAIIQEATYRSFGGGPFFKIRSKYSLKCKSYCMHIMLRIIFGGRKALLASGSVRYGRCKPTYWILIRFWKSLFSKNQFLVVQKKPLKLYTSKGFLGKLKRGKTKGKNLLFHKSSKPLLEFLFSNLSEITSVGISIL